LRAGVKGVWKERLFPRTCDIAFREGEGGGQAGILGPDGCANSQKGESGGGHIKKGKGKCNAQQRAYEDTDMGDEREAEKKGSAGAWGHTHGGPFHYLTTHNRKNSSLRRRKGATMD